MYPDPKGEDWITECLLFAVGLMALAVFACYILHYCKSRPVKVEGFLVAEEGRSKRFN